MAATSANKQKAYIRTSEASSQGGRPHNIYVYTWIGCEVSNNLSRSQEAVECSDKSSDWAKFLSGKKGGSYEVTAYADNTDPGQKALLKGLSNGSRVYFYVGQVQPSGIDDTIPLEGELGRCLVTEISDTNDFGAVASRTMRLTVIGEMTHYPEFEDDPEIEED